MKRSHDASGIIIIDEYNRVLLVHQTYGKKQWSVPGGVVEEGESAWDGARRELLEEVNIKVNEMDLSGIYFMSHRNGYIYTFKSYEYDGDIEVDNKEIDEYGFFEIDNLPRPISNFTIERLIDAVKNNKTVFKDQHIDNYLVIE
ncbi:NUDIX domain-containing protein [Paenibacillus sp. ALJ109b]|uniref:NUDIX domain-containing protein n=1 Tax=Paenibacillus sp. ALJ109b TaxID=2709068 RepID=UPI0013D86E7B|nr:NUDIX domain-containing protein [Paenibacillus sp. ALJ109b]NEU63999.1 NUDIX domain-containing protein [Paenibacillus sp. ALJ109b]